MICTQDNLTHSLHACILDRVAGHRVVVQHHLDVIIPDPASHPTITVPHAARIVGIARRTGYLAAERGDWPVLRVGRAVRVRTAQFLTMYGLVQESDAPRRTAA